MMHVPPLKKLLSSLLLPLPLLALPACGPSVEDLCDAQCDCEGCNDDERDKCISGGEKLESEADRLDCDDEFDDYIECLDDEMRCESGGKFDDGDRCKGFQKNLEACGVDN